MPGVCGCKSVPRKSNIAMVCLNEAEPGALCAARLRSSFFFSLSLPTARPQLSHDKSVGAGRQSEDYVIIAGMSHPSGSTLSQKQGCTNNHL